MRERWKNTWLDEILIADFISRSDEKIQFADGIYFIPIRNYSEILDSVPAVRQYGILAHKKYGIALLQDGLVLFWSASSEVERMAD